VGNFNWHLSLASPATLHVGDEIALLLEVTGEGNFDSVTVPELCCQPGISGLFDLSNLPPVGEKVADGKRFHLVLRPLSTAATTIPSLEFSAFDPNTQKYVISHTEPITLQVAPAPHQEHAAEDALDAYDKGDANPAALPAKAPIAEIEIESLYRLKVQDLYDLSFGNWWSLLLIPFGVGALLFQQNLKRDLLRKELEPKVVTSQQLLAEAVAASLTSAEGESLLCRALLLKLKENGEIPSAEISAEMLPDEGACGKVRQLLSAIQERRYAGKVPFAEKELQGEVQQLLEELQTLREVP
jgi:hypothetical protein